MRYHIAAVAALIIIHLSINALSQQSEAEKYLNDSLKELSGYDSDDPFGPATPHEARGENNEVQRTNNTTAANTTAVQGITAPNATTSEVTPGNSSSPAVSLVDNYINDSIKNFWEGSYESDDPLGAANPRESRRLNEEAHNKK